MKPRSDQSFSRDRFQPVRQRGSHLFMKHPDGRSTVIPVHPGEELGRRMLREMLKPSSYVVFTQKLIQLLDRLNIEKKAMPYLVILVEGNLQRNATVDNPSRYPYMLHQTRNPPEALFY